MKKRIEKRMLAWMLTFAMVLSMIPVTAFAEEDPKSTECIHSHDASCSYVEAVEEIPCDKACTDTDGDGLIDHAEECVYTPAVEGQPCTHVHDENCGGVIVEQPEKTHTLAENLLQALLEQYFAGVDAEGIYQVILEMDIDTRLGMIKAYEELLAAWTEEDEYNESLLELIEEIGHGISVAAENEQPLLPVPYQTNVMALEGSNSSNSIELRKIDGSGEAFVYHSFHEITGFTSGETYAFLDSFYGEEDAVSALGSGAILKVTTAENGSSKYIKKKYGVDATVKVYVDVITKGNDFDSCVIGGLYKVPNSGTPTEYRYFCGYGGAQNCGPYYAYNYVKESLTYANVSAYLKDIEKQGSENPEDYSVRITYDGKQSKTLDAGSYTVQIPDPASDRVIIVVSDSEGNSITANFRCPLAIRYDGNSEDASNVPSVQAAWKGESCTISSQTPTRDGYGFINWKDANTETFYLAGASISPAKSMKLLAQWKDTQAPNVGYTPTQVMTGDSDETVKNAVKAALTVTDNEPVSECTVTVTVPSDFTKTPGNKNVTVTVKDKAGNTTTETCSVYVSSYVDISEPVFNKDTKNLTATLNNPGTDTVTESGFVCGVMNSPSLTVNNGKAKTTTTAIKAGDIISVTADNLQKGVTYYARAYITAGGITYYSKEITIGLGLPAYGTFTVKNNGNNTFNVTRSDGSEGEQIVYYRTVNGSAVGGTHFTHQNGTLTFHAGETSKDITITEQNANTAYSDKTATAYSNADRTYSVEIYRVTGGGTLGSTTSATRTMKNGNAYTVERSIYNEQVINGPQGQTNRGDYDSDKLGWTENKSYTAAIETISIKDSLLSGIRNYWTNTAQNLYYQLSFTAWEEDAGYQAVQISPGTSLDTSAYPYDNKLKGSLGSAYYMALFEHDGSGKSARKLTHTFPRSNNTQSLSQSERVVNNSYVLFDISQENLSVGYGACGDNSDKWYTEEVKHHFWLNDTTEPQLVAVAPMAGGLYKVGDSFTVSLIFDEIVDSTNSPNLSSVVVNTSWGSASYIGGANTNVLYFKGTVASNASSTLSVNEITNLSYIKDMCDSTTTKETASGTGTTGATVDTSVPNFTVTANGITNGTGKATIKINADQTKTTGMSYVWSDSTTAPTTGWVELSSTELTTAKGSSGLPLSIRKESGSGAAGGKWYLHVKAVYATTGASAYKNACLDFGTAASPAAGSTPPTLTVSADNTDWATSRSISISAQGAESLKYRKSGETLWITLSETATSVTVEENGYYTFLLTAGDVAISKTVQVEKIDRENPTASVGKLTSDSVESPKSGVYTKIVLPITYADAQSGVETVQYEWTNSTATPDSWNTLQSGATTVTYTANESALTTKYLHLKVTDNVGHAATTYSSAYKVISQTAVNNHTPKITITGVPASWTNDTATLTWQLSDYVGKNFKVILPDGKTSTEPSGQVWARRNGIYTVKVRDLEYGGENTASVTVDRLDFDPPSVTVSGGSSSWSKDNQTFTITANDSQSGVDEKWYKIVSTTGEIPTGGLTKFTGNTITVSDEGEHYVYYKVYDKTGDMETSREANKTEGFTELIKIDKTPPMIGNLSYNYQPNNLWEWLIGKESLVITVPVTDNTSGVKTLMYTETPSGGTAETKTITLSGTTGTQTANLTLDADWKGTITNITCTDKAGNVSDSKAIEGAGNGIIVEDNAPAITITQADMTDTAHPKPGNTVSEDYYDENNAPTLYVAVKDDIAGETTVITAGIQSISYTINGGTAVNVIGSFTTALTGNWDFTIPLDGKTGLVNVEVTAVDHAGNTANSSVVVKIKGKEATPEAQPNYRKDALTNLVPGVDYKITIPGEESGSSVTITCMADENGEIPFIIKDENNNSIDLCGKTIAIARKGDGTNSSDSDAQNLSMVSRPAAPSVTKTDETIKGKNHGTLTGVDTTMEYSVDGGDNWTSITGSSITGLEPGTIRIRKKATTSSPHGEVQTVTIAEGRTLTVTFESNGGSNVSSITGKSWNDIVNKPEDPEREGYAFEGWYQDSSFETIWHFAPETWADKLTDDVTLYAKWTLNKPSVTLTDDGGTTNPVTGVIEAVYNNGNTLITLTAKPTHAAAAESSSSNITYTYKWYRDGQELTNMGSTAVSLTLTDVNQSGTYTVKVTARDGEGRISEVRSSNEVTLNIAKAPITFTVSENTYHYDATSKTAVVNQTSEELPRIDTAQYEVSYEKDGIAVDAPKDAGTYDVLVTLKDNNFSHYGQSDSVMKQKVGELSILKKQVTAVWTNLTAEYNGTAQAPECSTLVGLMGADAEDVSADFTAEQRLTNAGTKRLTAVLGGERADNYRLTNPDVNFTVQKAPVTFAVADNFVQADGHAHKATVSAYASGEAFDASNYAITYRNATGQAVEEPADTGTYAIYAELINPNYRHSGTADGTACQIGVLTMYRNQTAKTYTVEYAKSASEVTGDLPTSQTGVSEGTLIYMPEKGNLARTGYSFTGWLLNGKLYQPGETFTMPRKNVTITACWKEATYHISGLVDREGNPLHHAVVTLMRGSEIIGETTTDADGKYSFEGVIPGLYNLVTSYDGITTTVKVLIVDADAEQNATLPAGRTNSILEVVAGVPAVIVGNLEKLFQTVEGSPVYSQIYTENDKAVVETGGTVEIRLTVEKVAEPDPTGAELLKEAMQKLPEAFDYQPELYLDLVLQKTVYPAEGSGSGSNAPQTETLSDSQVILESVISLPSNLQNRRFYKVYRIHQNAPGDIVLEELTTEPNAEGEYYELNPENTELTIHARKYSVYTVAASDYVEPQPEKPESSGGTEGHPDIGSLEEEKKVENSQVNKKPLEEEQKLPEESDPETEKTEESPEEIPVEIPEDTLPEQEQREEPMPVGRNGKSFVVLNVLLTLLSLVMAVLLLLGRQERRRKIVGVTAAAASLLILLLTLGFAGVRIADLRTILFALLAAITVFMNLASSKQDKEERVL